MVTVTVKVRDRVKVRVRVRVRVRVSDWTSPPRVRACAVAVGEVAALQHEVGDDTVEAAAPQVERLAAGGEALLAGAQRSEVLGRSRHLLAVQAALDAARRLAADRKLQEDARCAVEGRPVRQAVGDWIAGSTSIRSTHR